MKTCVILCMLVILASAASAEIYRWEDANGVNFSDNASSVPEEYLEKPPAEARVQPEKAVTRVREAVYRQNTIVANQEKLAADHRANLEQHRQAAETKKQELIETEYLQNTLKSLAKFIVIWLLLGLFLFVVWVTTIVDVARSNFITTSVKTVWMLLVIFLPLFGMLLYMVLGSNQKSL